MGEATIQEWIREYNKQQKRACDAEAQRDDLLAACEATMQYIEDRHAEIGKRHAIRLTERETALMGQIQAAIAQAKGE